MIKEPPFLSGRRMHSNTIPSSSQIVFYIMRKLDGNGCGSTRIHPFSLQKIFSHYKLYISVNCVASIKSIVIHIPEFPFSQQRFLETKFNEFDLF